MPVPDDGEGQLLCSGCCSQRNHTLLLPLTQTDKNNSDSCVGDTDIRSGSDSSTPNNVYSCCR